ncbi:hypothetical protein [Piscinibacter sp.]|uniref:hypothetical protein n=1 Tax=Piscinibacter sp. TaxID=1903157 RepID=UPI002BDB6748|nr:hypothetical protein [Albitalea sp.]HUG21263.1 hypothetical protein [Albitalea sp.]
MSQSTERADTATETARPNAAAGMTNRLPSARISREQLAAAQRASEYHARRVPSASAAAEPVHTDAARAESSAA